MPKWSDYIRNLGTAGPATLEGIKALGFALTSEIPGLVAKYVRVDAAQTFTNGEKQQGRDNIGLGSIATQDADDVEITGGTVSGLADPLAVGDGGTGAATAGDARDNLGLGNVDNTSDANKPVSTATQNALDLKAPLSGPVFTDGPEAPTAAVDTDSDQIATTAFVMAQVKQGVYRLAKETVFTSGATWTPVAGIKAAEFIVQGGGGGGGGAAGSGSGTSGGAGGGAGAFVSRFLADGWGASETITVGAAGAMGAGAAGNGGAGGTSSVGTLAVAGGGSGGAGCTRTATIQRGAGPAGAGGAASGSGGTSLRTDIFLDGTRGGVAALYGSLGVGGIGAPSAFGGGGGGVTEGSLGQPAGGFGAGGGGACENSTSDRPGGLGGAGVVIIREFV
jgi:hypothetical protein